MSVYPAQNKKRAERDAVRPIRSVSGICPVLKKVYRKE